MAQKGERIEAAAVRLFIGKTWRQVTFGGLSAGRPLTWQRSRVHGITLSYNAFGIPKRTRAGARLRSGMRGG